MCEGERLCEGELVAKHLLFGELVAKHLLFGELVARLFLPVITYVRSF